MTLQATWRDKIATSPVLKAYAADHGALFTPAYGEDAQKLSMPIVQANAWQLYNSGKTKVSPGLGWASRRSDPEPPRERAQCRTRRPKPRTSPSPHARTWRTAAGWLVLGPPRAGRLADEMDRLADQDVPPYTAPGLLPGLLGLALLLFGALLAARSLLRGAASARPAHGAPVAGGRAALVILLCVVFGTMLVGHGLPFWLAATLFVAAAILLLQRPILRPGLRPNLAAAGRAALIGLCAGWAITLVFQHIFLVRLP